MELWVLMSIQGVVPLVVFPTANLPLTLVGMVGSNGLYGSGLLLLITYLLIHTRLVGMVAGVPTTSAFSHYRALHRHYMQNFITSFLEESGHKLTTSQLWYGRLWYGRLFIR